MRKLLAAILATFLVLSFVGCGKQSDPNTSITTLAPPTGSTTKAPTTNSTTQLTTVPVYMHPSLSTSPEYLTNYTPDDIPEVYWNVINNKQPIHFPYACPDCKQSTTPCDAWIDFYNFVYLYTPIATSNNVTYAVVDMDGDGKEELLIRDSDTLLLRERDGVIYGYSIMRGKMDDVYTDGSYAWDFYGGQVYGRRKVSFLENNNYITIDLYKFSSIADPEGIIYVGGKEVTMQKYEEYHKTLCHSKVEWKRMERFPILIYNIPVSE